MKKSLFTLLVMMLFGTAIAQPTSSYFRTQFDMGIYENSYSLIAVIKIDGEIQNDLNLELGAWDETYSTYCGGQLGAYYDAYQQGTIPCYYMAVFGYRGDETNPATGESLAPLGQSLCSYRIYDHGMEQVRNDLVCDVKVLWTNTLYGMPSTPVELNFYTKQNMHFLGTEDSDWSNPNNWFTDDGEPAGRIPGASEDVTIDADCTVDIEGEAATITVTPGHTLTVGDDGSFDAEVIVNDGGQFISPEGYSGIIEKEIHGYGNSTRGNYYFISVPLTEFDLTTGFQAAGMLEGDYDLYFFTQNPDNAGVIDPDDEETWWQGEWQNYKWYLNPDSYMGGAEAFSDGYQINNSYLYASKETKTITFSGAFNSGSVQYTMANASGSEWPGFQLVGNPLPCNASITAGNKITGYYKMNNQGNDVIAVNNPIVAPATALLIVSNGGNPATQRRVTFEPTEEEANVIRSANSMVTVEVLSDNGDVEDRAYVRNYESEDLVKYSLSNEGTKIFIPQNGKKYAAVYAGETKSMPLCFTSTEGGIHTITVKAENMNCSYLHLIDNVTGADIDLLRTPKYSFDANNSNYATRFKLVFDEQATNEIADNFAFISNGELMINNNGEATLQVMDITGRILSTENIQNCYSKSLNLSAGVYVVRLSNGNDVKAQKIVVE